MSNIKRNSIQIIQNQIDLLIISLSWIVSYYLRFKILPTPKGVPEQILYFKLIPFIIIIWFFVFWIFNFSTKIGKHKSPLIESIHIVKNCILATFIFIGFTYFYDEYKYSRLTIGIFSIVHIIALICTHSLLRKIFRAYKSKLPSKKIFIIANSNLLNNAIAIANAENYVRSIIYGVFIVDDKTPNSNSTFNALVGAPDSWTDYFVNNPCDQVIIALNQNQLPIDKKSLEEISEQIPDIKIIPDLTVFAHLSNGVEMINNTLVINVHDSPLSGVGRIYKRIFDIIGSILALILFSPFFLISSILIKLTSKGPIFYYQERMGIDGIIFTIYKFRTMTTNSEKNEIAQWTTKNDTRTTHVGKWLRKSSLDELPQFWNVLRGDMSLVGPRPERPIFVNKFRRNIPGYMLRHKVKAGITGWAQINGWRGDTSIEKRIEYDLHYIKNWSLWIDFKILLLTIFKGFINPNAY